MIVKIDGYTLDAICQYVNENYPQFSEVQVSNIVSTRIEDSFIMALIDCGIKGTPKFRIPIEKLEFMVKPEVKEERPTLKMKQQATNGRRKRGKE